jgi:hypothetical protein
MIVVELASGFGNQLFQYAASLALSKTSGNPIHLNRTKGSDHGNRDYREIFTGTVYGADITDTVITGRYNGYILNTYKQAYGAWDPRTIKVSPIILLRGYFQYLPPLIPILPQLRIDLFGQLQMRYAKDPIENAAFIHVRRGDYLNLENNLPVQTKEYFERGIQYIDSKKNIDKWIMISNDIPWCKKQKWSRDDIEFIDEPDEVRLFWWMLNWTQGAVISNSTYSWWGAILGAHNKGSPVVYPKVWHLEHKPTLFPDKWICL